MFTAFTAIIGYSCLPIAKTLLVVDHYTLFVVFYLSEVKRAVFFYSRDNLVSDSDSVPFGLYT